MLEPFSHEHFMKQALQQADNAFNANEVPIGALVVANNRVIAKAHNQTNCLNDTTAHAEMLALTAAMQQLGSKYLKNCRLYVSLEPCAMCAGAIKWSQIDMVVFGAHDQKFGYSQYHDGICGKAKIIGGIMEAQSAEKLGEFFKSKRKNH